MNSQLDFMAAARSVGVNDQTPLYLVHPHRLGDALLTAAKRHARFLETASPSLGHRKMLEVVAKAAGFPDWHSFHTLTTRMIQEYEPPMRGSVPKAPLSLFEAVVPSLPLLIQVREDCAPSQQELHGMKALGKRLAEVMGEPAPKVLDILARLQGADSMAQLCNRNPEDSSHPLYTFALDFDQGIFRWSPACANLVEKMDELWPSYEKRSKTEQHQARSFITAVVAKRPDFLEGLLALATIEELDGHPKKAGPLFEQAIKQADSLILSGFKGQIVWMRMENRFYLRLLYNHMRWHMRYGQLAKAINLARRQLKLNPDDNLGVRLDLPVLLTANKQYDSAKAPLRRLQRTTAPNDGDSLLVQSQCHIAAGRVGQGQALFLRALFALPALRPGILELRIPDMYDKRWHRGIIPDLTTLWGRYETIHSTHPGIETIFNRILQDKTVIEMESIVANCFQTTVDDLRNNRVQSMAPWHEFVVESSEMLVAKLGEKWSGH